MTGLPIDAPIWLYALLFLLGGGFIGNLAKPLFDFGARRAEAAVGAAQALRDDMMQYSVELKAEITVIKNHNRDLMAQNIDLTNSLVDFRSFVISEAGQAKYHNFRDEKEQVDEKLDTIIDGARRVRFRSLHAVTTDPDAG